MRIGIAAAKDQLPALIHRAQAGEKILLTRNGHIVAQLRGFPKRKPENEWVGKLMAELFSVTPLRERKP